MTYEEAIGYLYRATPVFQHSGGSAYKPGLDRVCAMAQALDNPHRELRCIHVGGTNGKGSTCHTLAAILQSQGYGVGLFTSPHLIDFRERIRVNGEVIDGAFVADFVEQTNALIAEWQPSFFELTTLMAFAYFRLREVDIAIIEVGMGGRLDSTNIITPLLSIITGISLDHTQFLGHTTAAIAEEKAGIIKPRVPIVIGEADENTRPVFEDKARTCDAPIFFAEDSKLLRRAVLDSELGSYRYETERYGILQGQLIGDVQTINARTVLAAISVLETYGILSVGTEAVRQGFSHVVQLTGLLGRWQQVGSDPVVICDTAHNEGGIAAIVGKLSRLNAETLRIVFGMASDKDVSHILPLLPKNASYYFCRASVDRAMPAEELATLAADGFGLQGKIYTSVEDAYKAALAEATARDIIYVGGSNFVVADLLRHLYQQTV